MYICIYQMQAGEALGASVVWPGTTDSPAKVQEEEAQHWLHKQDTHAAHRAAKGQKHSMTDAKLDLTST